MVSLQINFVFHLFNIVALLENCADSDEMPQDVASHLSLQCLYKYSFMCFQPGMPAKECNATKQGRVKVIVWIRWKFILIKNKFLSNYLFVFTALNLH